RFFISKEYAGRAGDEGTKAEALLGLGIAYSQLGKYREALAAAIEACEFQERLGYPLRRIASLRCIASTYSLLSDFKAALKYAKEGLDCARQIAAKDAEAAILHTMGGIQLALGNYAEALTLQRTALELNQALHQLPC